MQDPCFVEGCRRFPTYIQNDERPHSFACNIHRESCNLSELSASHNFTEIELAVEESDKFLMSHSSSKIEIFRMRRHQIEFPDQLKTCVNKLIKEISKDFIILPKQHSEKLNQSCNEFFFEITKIIRNISLKFKEISNYINRLFIEMHTMLDNKTVQSLQIMIENFITQGIIVDFYAGGFLSSSLSKEDASNNFFTQVLQFKEFEKATAIKAFNSAFDKLIKNKEHIEKGFFNFESEFMKYKTELHDSYMTTIKNFLAEAIMKTKIEIIFIDSYEYRYKIKSKSAKANPVWEPAFAMYFEANEYFIQQSSQISSISCLTLVSTNTNRSFIISFEDNKATLSLELASSQIIIASGSSPETIFILQNHPRKLLKYYKDANHNFIEYDNFDLKLETLYSVTSLAYINLTEIFLYSTACNKSFMVYNDEITESCLLKLNEREEVISFQYFPLNRLVLQQTTERLGLFSPNVEPLFIINIIAPIIKLFHQETELFYMWLEKNKVRFNNFKLSISDEFKLNKYNKRNSFTVFDTFNKVRATTREGLMNISRNSNQFMRISRSLNYNELIRKYEENVFTENPKIVIEEEKKAEGSECKDSVSIEELNFSEFSK